MGTSVYNNRMKLIRIVVFVLLALFAALPSMGALEKQPASVYHGRRVALAGKLHGGIAVLFAAEEAQLDLTPYRQDEDFYYLTGWNEPGAALLIVAEPESSSSTETHSPRHYAEILFLPTRNLRQEKYTGVKLDAATPGAAASVGVDAVKPMTELPAVLNELIDSDRLLASHLWVQGGNEQAKNLLGCGATRLGRLASRADVCTMVQELRVVGRRRRDGTAEESQDTSRRTARDDESREGGSDGASDRGQMTAAWLEVGASGYRMRLSSARGSTRPRCTTLIIPQPCRMAMWWL
jgi:Xaa-Pro aminopeptidase